MRRLRRRGGQVLVELAIILPIVIGMAVAILDLGLLVVVHLRFSSAAAETIKVAPLNNRTPGQLRNYFDEGLGLDTENRTFIVTTDDCDGDVGNRPTANIYMAYDHAWLGWWPWANTTEIRISYQAKVPLMVLPEPMNAGAAQSWTVLDFAACPPPPLPDNLDDRIEELGG